jgi:hypothetical protein
MNPTMYGVGDNGGEHKYIWKLFQKNWIEVNHEFYLT